jgi:nicotinamide phosphoribosyltransferase
MNAIPRIDCSIDDINTIELTDSYKVSHHKQYPQGARYVYSFFESRGGRFPTTTFFGLQYYLKKYLAGVVVTEANVEEAADDFELHFGTPALYNRAGWDRILKVHGGRLPLLIKAVPEGTTVPTHNALMTIENTDPELPWLTNYAETLLSMVWYPMTVCTQSRAMRKVLLEYLEKTGDPSLIDFKLHDFGFRGSTSVESAGIGGMSHLVNFKGTDTTQALRFARKYYHERMAGFSIPASEHSTITSWGREHEADAMANMLEQFPSGLVACVSDSYDIYNACENIWGSALKEKILMREGTLVVRPDSGDATEVLPRLCDILGERLGHSVNQKGYKLLNPKIRLIQGDAVEFTTLKPMLDSITSIGWSADNIAFGSGGGLLQKVNRDTQKCAIKNSAIDIDDMWHDVMKDPVTDPGKRSKAGRLALVQKNGAYSTIREDEA